MSFDFLKSDTIFAEFPDEYEVAPNFLTPSQRFSTLPQHHRTAVKRMVVVKPKRESKTWIQEAESLPLAATFKELTETIELKYGHQSSLQHLLFSEEYMTVIGFGPRVVPLLLADLKSGNTPWFWALKAITREDVGGDVGAGDFHSLREAWLTWGTAKRLL